jgi:AcrR family transcriptional regulator
VSTRGRTRLDPQTRRGQILDAACSVFERRDPSEVTFEEIAERAGVSRALVYTYFGDRGGLLAAVLRRNIERLGDHLDAANDGELSAEDRVRRTVERYLEVAERHPGGWRLLQWSAGFDHPEVRSARAWRIERLAEVWGGSDAARVVASGVVGLLEASTVDWLECATVDREAAATAVFDLLWSGLQGLCERGVITP